MILNDATSSAFEKRELRLSFVLDDGQIPSPASTDPPPEILVASNLFQGRIRIRPNRFPPNTQIPPPMDSWEFLNTVTT
jgi:hypothetical protein